MFAHGFLNRGGQPKSVPTASVRSTHQCRAGVLREGVGHDGRGGREGAGHAQPFHDPQGKAQALEGGQGGQEVKEPDVGPRGAKQNPSSFTDAKHMTVTSAIFAVLR